MTSLQKADKPRILIYCGLNKAMSFSTIYKNYDYCFAFEANPHLFADPMYAKLQLCNNVKIIHAALTTFDGEIDFNILKNDTASSVGNMCDKYLAQRMNNSGFQVVEKIKVPAVNLYNFCIAHQIDYIDDYISDLQGMDLEVLKTMLPYIKQGKIKNIQCEVAKTDNVYNLPNNNIHAYEQLLGPYYRKIAEGDGLLDQGFQPVPENYWTYDVKWKVKDASSISQYYSQMAQDKILDTELFHCKEGGFFVEVGATDGQHFSNTLFFEKWRGWKGICIEPNPIEFAKLKNSGRTCIKENYAICSQEGETDFLAIDGYGKGLSGIISLYDPRHLDRIDQELKGRDSTKHVYKVKTIPLQNLLDSHNVAYVDYCSIDVEGAEMQVLESIDFDKTYIKCLTIENNYGLEKETKFLTSKGYLLWKRVGCDDFFVKIDEYSNKAISNHQTAASGGKYSPEELKKKISAHYASFLPFREQMAIEASDPLKILDYTRFDVPAKVIYARHRHWQVNSNWPVQVYDEHIRAFNGYDERDGTGKKGLKMFLNAFNAVIDSVRTRGFDPDTSVIPVSLQGELLEGAHRLAACLVYNKQISTVKFDFKPWIYDYRFFLSRGLSPETADAIALEFCRLKKNTHLVFLFPSAIGSVDKVMELLKKYSDIVYEKKISLRNDGPLLLMRQIYRDENWLGNYKNNFPGARLKARECFRSNEPLRLFVVETDNNDALKQVKQEIRDIYGIGNHSIHISDTHEESLRIARLLLNSNGVHFLNNAKIGNFEHFEKNLLSYKKALANVEEEWFCVGGSAVMSIYGLREARDIDYLHFREPLLKDDKGLVSSHNKEAGYYPLSIDDIIFNPKNHFYYDGVKFSALSVIRQMKSKRGEEKDGKDLLLMDPLLRPEISIVILNYNGLKLIKPCIESIEKNTKEAYEIVIIDNASTDGSLEYLRTVKNALLVENKENLGCPPARALGLPLAKGNFVVLLDNDTIVTEGWIEKFKAHFQRYPDIGILGPRSNYVSGAQLVPNVPYRDMSGLEIFARKWADDHKGVLIPTHRLVGFCMFISRAVVDKIGNIDASFGKFGYEDDDYTWRAIIAGFKTAIANDVFIHHSGGPQGQGNIGYNQRLLDAWEFWKRKWGIPVDIKYGEPYNILPYLLQVFQKEHHYIPLNNSGDAKSPYKKCLSDNPAAEGIPSLLHHEFTANLTSVIIFTHNRLDQTKKCVKNISKYTPEAHEIIFVDNCSTDGTAKWLQGQARVNKNYHLIENKESIELIKGLNQGINLSTGEFILLLDNDVVVSSGWLTGMLECLKVVPLSGIVGPMTNNGTGLQQVTDESYPSSGNQFDKYAAEFKERFHHRRIASRNIAGVCLLFKRALAHKIGLLDEQLGSSGFAYEDFCIRAALKGYCNYIAGDVFIQRPESKNIPGDRSILDKKWTLNLASSEGKKLAVLKAKEFAADFYARGNINQAVETLINCIKFTPEDKEIYYELTRMFIESKRFAEAWEVFGTMPETGKNDLKGLEYAGYAKEGLGLDDEAAVYADKILSQNKNYPAALNLKGVLAYKKGEKETAADYFRKTMDADPGYGETYTNLGVLYWGTDKKDDALLQMKKGFRLSPTVPDVSSVYYSAINSLGICSDAEAEFREACTTYPNNKNLTFLYIDILIQQGKFDLAMLKIEDALALFDLDEGILQAALAVREKIGPRQIDPAARKGTLSVCMIVKNEEKFLVKCLRSIRDVANEIIVVDTGSTDKTADIARVFGAKLFDFPWTGDFSAARNHSLAQATGNWIFILDADEVISELDYDELRTMIRKRSTAPVAYSINTRNYIHDESIIGWTPNDGKYPEQPNFGWMTSAKIRLFPRRRDIFFINPVHELVEKSVSDAKIPILTSDIAVHHFGKLDKTKDVQKGLDYYLLGKMKYENDPTNVKYILELAKQAQVLRKNEEAVELWLKLLARIEGDSQSADYRLIAKISYGDPLSEIYTQLAAAYLLLDRYEDALQAARRAMETKTKLKEYVNVYATCEIIAGSLESARDALEEQLKTMPDYSPALFLIALIFCLTGKKEKAGELFQLLRRKNVLIIPRINNIARQLHTYGKNDEALIILNTAMENKAYNQETQLLLEKLQKI